MYNNQKGTRKNRKGSSSKNKTRKTPVVASAVKSYVKKEIARNEESKKTDVRPDLGAAAQDLAYCVDCSPTPVQGDGEAQRDGLKVLLTGARFELQINTQVSTANAIKFKYYIVNYVDAINPLLASAIPGLFLDVNTFSPLHRDYHSLRNPENLQSLKIIAQGRGTIGAENIAGHTGFYQISRNLRLNKLQKYPSDAINSTIVNHLYLLVVTDTGSTASSTGITINSSFRYWFKDS